MDQYYLNKLDPVCKFLVHKIESSIKSVIKVKVDESKEILSCYTGELGGIIFTPKQCHFPCPSVYHELLHIRRFCVDGIPKIYSVCADGIPIMGNKTLVEIDQAIEHFIIIPEELKKNEKRIPYWKNKYKETLDKCGKMSHPKRQGASAILIWIHVDRLFPGSDLSKQANKILEMSGLKARATDIKSKLMQSIDRKEDLVKIFLPIIGEVSGTTYDGVCLEYLDCKNVRSCLKSFSFI